MLGHQMVIITKPDLTSGIMLQIQLNCIKGGFFLKKLIVSKDVIETVKLQNNPFKKKYISTAIKDLEVTAN